MIAEQRKLPILSYYGTVAVRNSYINLFDWYVSQKPTLLYKRAYGNIIHTVFTSILLDPEHIEMLEHILVHYPNLINPREKEDYDTYRMIISGHLISDQEIPRLIIPALLYNSLFTNQHDVFNYIYTNHPDTSFFQSYFNHPNIITPENLRLVKSYLTPGQKGRYANILTEKLYSDYAQELLS